MNLVSNEKIKKIKKRFGIVIESTYYYNPYLPKSLGETSKTQPKRLKMTLVGACINTIIL